MPSILGKAIGFADAPAQGGRIGKLVEGSSWAAAKGKYSNIQSTGTRVSPSTMRYGSNNSIPHDYPRPPMHDYPRQPKAYRNVQSASGTNGYMGSTKMSSNLNPLSATHDMNMKSVGMGLMTGAGVGAAGGALFGNRDGTWHGAARGAIGGAMGGALLGTGAGFGMPAVARMGVTNKGFMSNAGSYSTGIISMSQGLNSAAGRSSLFAAGGLLGGTMGGSGANSKKSGFNRNRGSRING